MKHDDFLDDVTKRQDRMFKAGLTIWAVWVLICLSFFGLIIYVAWHFISKLW